MAAKSLFSLAVGDGYHWGKMIRAIAYGDPDAKLGFSFCGNRMASTRVTVSGC